MAKPIVNKITPFDAEMDKEIGFTWNGSQSYANRLIIYNADSMEKIYDKTITTFTHSHTIPAGTLKNGKQWIAQSQTFDVDHLESGLSDKRYFQTFKTPLFYFYGLENGQTVTRHFIVDEKSILFSTVSTPLRHLHFADRTLLSRKLCSQIKIFRLELCVQ